jgi:hypothetical protein
MCEFADVRLKPKDRSSGEVNSADAQRDGQVWVGEVSDLHLVLDWCMSVSVCVAREDKRLMCSLVSFST